jgi:hypothetical protein
MDFLDLVRSNNAHHSDYEESYITKAVVSMMIIIIMAMTATGCYEDRFVSDGEYKCRHEQWLKGKSAKQAWIACKDRDYTNNLGVLE